VQVNGEPAATDAAERWPATLAVVDPAWPARRICRADWRRYADYLAEILEALGLELDTPGTRDTPQRLLHALFDSTAGYDGDAKLLTAFPSEARSTRPGELGQIIEGPIEFHALCEHHALPFYGVAHVGYVAGEEIIGISKLTRLVRLFSKRFTVQERIGEEIADTLVELIAPAGVAVHLEASHLCTRMRGVKEHSATVTTFWRGSYADSALRQEFLTEVRARKTTG
jgi:GTP cyclohydrolase I